MKRKTTVGAVVVIVAALTLAWRATARPPTEEGTATATAFPLVAQPGYIVVNKGGTAPVIVTVENPRAAEGYTFYITHAFYGPSSGGDPSLYYPPEMGDLSTEELQIPGDYGLLPLSLGAMPVPTTIDVRFPDSSYDKTVLLMGYYSRQAPDISFAGP